MTLILLFHSRGSRARRRGDSTHSFGVISSTKRLMDGEIDRAFIAKSNLSSSIATPRWSFLGDAHRGIDPENNEYPKCVYEKISFGDEGKNFFFA